MDSWNQLEATQNLMRKDFHDRESSKRLSNQLPSDSPPIKQPRPTLASEGILPLPTSNSLRPRMRPILRGPPPRQRGLKPGLLETPTPDNLIGEEIFMYEEEDDGSLEHPRGPRPRHFFPRPGPHNLQHMGHERMFGPRGFRGNGMKMRGEGFRPMRPRFSGELRLRRGGPTIRPGLHPERMLGHRQPRRGLLDHPHGLLRPRMRPTGPRRMRHPF